MLQFNLPAVCPTCGSVFPSGIVLGEGSSATMEGNRAGPCPNGHMGIIPDGIYSAIGDLYRYFISPEGQPIVQKIISLSRSVATHHTAPADGLEDMADLLPKELGAAVRKLGSKNPLTAFLVVLAVISSITLIGSNVAGIYKTLSPSAPTAPSIIINNNPSIINQNAAGNRSNQTVSNRMSRQQRRQNERQQKEEQRARPSQGETPSEAVAPRAKRPKARHLRRTEKEAQRRRLNPRGQSDCSCD